MPLSLLPEKISRFVFSYLPLTLERKLKEVYCLFFSLATSSFSAEEDSCVCDQ